MNLEEQSCVPCHSFQDALTDAQIEAMMKQLDGKWSRNAKGHIEKTFSFKNFFDAMNFANKITRLADAEGHHPDLHISWGKCIVEIWTHFISGLSKNDFYLAAKIEKLAKEEGV